MPAPSEVNPGSATRTTADGPAWPRGEKVRYVGGELQLRAGVTVHEQRANPLGYHPPFTSDGLDISYRGTGTWVLVEVDHSGFGLAESTPSEEWASFDDWLVDQVADARSGPHGSGWPNTLRPDPAGEVVADALSVR